jgi:hypothetical protein
MVHTSRSKALLSKHHGIASLRNRRLLVLQHGPSPRLQGVAIAADYDPSVKRSDSGRHFLVCQSPTASRFEASPSSLWIIRPACDIHNLAPRRIRLFAFHRIPRLRLRSARQMAIFLLAHARTCAARLLDCRAHTAHTQPTALVGPVQTALGSSHGCSPSASCPSDRHILHPCVVAAQHILHARPPDTHLPHASGTRW